MKYLLDTNVVSELRKAPGRVDSGVLAWASSEDEQDMALSVVTVLELGLGVARLARKGPVQGSRLRDWYERVILEDFAERTLPITPAIARRCVELHIPDPRPDRDAWIAAAALEHGLVVVTRNTSDFAPTGVELLNPWRSGLV